MKKNILRKIGLFMVFVLIFTSVNYVWAEEDDGNQDPGETTVSPEPSENPEVSEEPTPTAEDTPTDAPTATPTPTNTPTPTKAATATPAPTKAATATPVPTKAGTPTPTPTPTKNTDPIVQKNEHEPPKEKSTKKIDIKSPKVIKIDGIYEDVWDNIEPVKIENVAWGTTGADGCFKTFWDKERLYILVDVNDTTPDTVSDMFTRQDCIEVFLNESNSKPSEYGEGDLHVKVNRDGKVEYGHHASEELIKYGVIEKDGGYMVELSIKFTSISPTYGTEIGFDVRINDSHGKQYRDKMLQWSDTSMETFSDLSKIGTITLK